MEKEFLYINGVYRHFKGGMYTVLLGATDESNKTNKVVYSCHETGVNWIRDYDEFTGYVEHEGLTLKRFEYVGSLCVDDGFFKQQ